MPLTEDRNKAATSDYSHFRSSARHIKIVPVGLILFAMVGFALNVLRTLRVRGTVHKTQISLASRAW